MRLILISILAALALSACTPLCKSPGEPQPDGAAPAGDIVQGTVRSIGEVVPMEELEPHTRYEDPLEEERRQIVVKLDDGSEVVIVYSGPREGEPGERGRGAGRVLPPVPCCPPPRRRGARTPPPAPPPPHWLHVRNRRRPPGRSP